MDKPHAIRLAEMIEDDMSCIGDEEIAAELRRLHQSQQEGWRWAKECEAEVKRLKEIIDELENDDPPSKHKEQA